MKPKTELQEQIVIQSLIESEQLVQSTRTHLEKLIFMSELVKNVLLVGKKYDGTKKITELFKENIIVEENDKLYMNPLTTDEQEQYITSNMTVELLYSEKFAFKTGDIESRIELLNEIMEKKKYFQEIIPIFISYLFPQSKNYNSSSTKKLTDDVLLDLYIMLAEEYNKMLQKRDIENMAILGQKTIQLIINTMYAKINSHKGLKSIDKGLLMLYMKKFFYTISNTITYLTPV